MRPLPDRSSAHGFCDDEPTRRLFRSRGGRRGALPGQPADHGIEVTERFTGIWERAAGTAYHPWGDVVTVVGFLDGLRDDWGSERRLVEGLLARAVAGLGG